MKNLKDGKERTGAWPRTTFDCCCAGWLHKVCLINQQLIPRINLRTICVIAVTASLGLADLRSTSWAESDAAVRRILPLGRQVKVCQEDCVVVRINNDHGPFVRNIDLTPAAARAIGLNEAGR